MTPQTMRAQELAAELRIHETEEYRVNAPQSIAKPWLSSAPLVGGAPFDFTAAPVAGSETAGKDAALYRMPGESRARMLTMSRPGESDGLE